MLADDIASLAHDGALAIREAFGDYLARFKAITRRAKNRFESRDWRGAREDASARLDLHHSAVADLLDESRRILGVEIQNKALWARMKAIHTDWVAGRPDIELSETFFNSVARQVFATDGIDPRIEYVDLATQRVPSVPAEPVYRVFPVRDALPQLMRDVLLDYRFDRPYRDLDGDAQLLGKRIEGHLDGAGHGKPPEAIEVLAPVFYRGKGAYLVGRIRTGRRVIPIVLALTNADEGISVDALMLSEDDVSIVFSFTRSYFHVEMPTPHGVIQFLRSLMPVKPVAELYTALGYNKHGKSELYRDLLRHLIRSVESFEMTPGDRGMVMVAFTMPSYEVVFKIIRDRFAPPKNTTRRDVMRRYQLVFRHDRAGRLLDAQEFEHLTFSRERFSDELLTELLDSAPSNVILRDRYVTLRHLYVERRTTPLNLYLRTAPPTAAREAVIDYGQAIKDLAATNIFPGDLLLKNFGVTRHRRVVFYDYDELCLMSDCRFRRMPAARHDDEEIGGEPWFYVGENDVFPEEFITFLGLPANLRKVFLDAHGELLDIRFWKTLQDRHRAGEIVDIFPYRKQRRLRPRGPGSST